MLNGKLQPDHESLALIRSLLHNHGDAEEKMKHLRETMSDNVILAGWLHQAQTNNSPEAMIVSLRERVEKFESNKHLREIEGKTYIPADKELIVEMRVHRSFDHLPH